MAVTINPGVGYEIVTLQHQQQHQPQYYDRYDINGSNSTTEYYDPVAEETDTFMYVLSILIPVLFGLIALIGISGNLLVIIVVVSNKQMRNSTNMLIINLALADLFFIIICVPFTAVGYVVVEWPFGLAFCKFYQYMINVTAYASVYTLVLMSLDRYLAVCHPIWSMGLRTERNALLVIVVSWVVILTVTIPIIFEYSLESIDRDSKICVYTKILEDDMMKRPPYNGRVFYACFFLFAYLLPLTLVCVLYGLLLRRLLCGGVTSSAESMRGKKRVTRMVTVVVAIFAICWLPMHIRFLIHFFGKYHENMAFKLFQVIANCLAYCNSCVNPILYAFLSENFRKSFRKLLCCYSDFQPMHIDYERTQVQPKEHIEFTKTYTATTVVDHDNCVNNRPENGNGNMLTVNNHTKFNNSTEKV